MDTLAWRPARIEFHYTRLAEFLVESGMWEQARRSGYDRDRLGVQVQMRQAMRAENVRLVNQNIHNIRPNPNEQDFGGLVEFAHAGDSRWDVVRWQIRWPDLLGRMSFEGYGTARRDVRRWGPGGRGIDVHITRSTTILHYSRTGEVIELRRLER